LVNQLFSHCITADHLIENSSYDHFRELSGAAIDNL
jgi:hypothetical protein